MAIGRAPLYAIIAVLTLAHLWNLQESLLRPGGKFASPPGGVEPTSCEQKLTCNCSAPQTVDVHTIEPPKESRRQPPDGEEDASARHSTDHQVAAVPEPEEDDVEARERNQSSPTSAARHPHGALHPTTKNKCATNDRILFIMAWRPRFIVSHVEEVRMRTKVRIVLLCPDSAAFETGVALFTSSSGRQLFGDVQVFLYMHTGNRATLSNGHYMIVATGAYLRTVLACDCREQLRLPAAASGSSASSPLPEHVRRINARFEEIRVFMFDPQRSAVCGNPFALIPKRRLSIVPLPVEDSQFYAYHYFLLKKAWNDDYVGTGITIANNHEDTDDGATTAPQTPAPTTEDGDVITERDRSEAFVEDVNAQAGKTAANNNNRGSDGAKNSSRIIDYSGGAAAIFTMSSAALGGSANLVAEFAAKLELAKLDNVGNFTTLDESGLANPRLTLGLEPLLARVAAELLGNRHAAHHMRSVQFPSTTYCPQFQAAARFCHRFTTRPALVVDYHHCDPRGPSPLTHHVALPSSYSNETFDEMLQGMCHSVFPYRMMRLDVARYTRAALETVPARYVDAWRAWKPPSSLPLPLLLHSKNISSSSSSLYSTLPAAHKLEQCSGGHRRNVIVTVATGYHAEKVKWLLRTFNRHRRRGCDVLVLIVSRYSGEYEPVVGKHKGIYLLKLRKFLPTIPDGTLRLAACPMVLQRIELLKVVMEREIVPKWDPQFVIMVDARDTFLQGNPFEALSRLETEARDEGHLLNNHKEFLAMPAMQYNWGSMELRVPQRFLINRQWAASLFPDSLFDAMRTARLHWVEPERRRSGQPAQGPAAAFNMSSAFVSFPALCGGMYLGTPRALADFFDLFTATAAASSKPCEANDQGLLLGLVPFGVAVAKFAHPILLLDPLQSLFTNEPDYGLSVRSDAKSVVTLNCLGEPFAVLHQFIPAWKGILGQLKKQLSSLRPLFERNQR